MIRISISEEHPHPQINGDYRPKTDLLFFQKIHDLIVKNLHIPSFGHKQIAARLLMSDSQFYRRIKTKKNKSPAIYCRSVRLQIARKLISDSNLNISQIAYHVGFSDPSYFSRTFYMEFGSTPSKFRN